MIYLKPIAFSVSMGCDDLVMNMYIIENVTLVKAIIGSGLYPNIACVEDYGKR